MIYKYVIYRYEFIRTGVECVDNMLFGTKEFTMVYPNLTNEGGSKNTDLNFGI